MIKNKLNFAIQLMKQKNKTSFAWGALQICKQFTIIIKRFKQKSVESVLDHF